MEVREGGEGGRKEGREKREGEGEGGREREREGGWIRGDPFNQSPGLSTYNHNTGTQIRISSIRSDHARIAPTQFWELVGPPQY